MKLQIIFFALLNRDHMCLFSVILCMTFATLLGDGTKSAKLSSEGTHYLFSGKMKHEKKEWWVLVEFSLLSSHWIHYSKNGTKKNGNHSRAHVNEDDGSTDATLTELLLNSDDHSGLEVPESFSQFKVLSADIIVDSLLQSQNSYFIASLLGLH